MIKNNIKFICERELPVLFSSLVINVESIEKLYPDGYKAFFLSDEFCMAYTNGFIVVFSEMQGYPAYLYSILDKLEPLGFQEGRDFVIGMEEIAVNSDGSPVPTHSIKWCEQADWLQSVISSKQGNLVWHTSFNKEQRTFFDSIDDEYPWTQYWTFWYMNHPVLRDIKFKKLNVGYPLFRLDESYYDTVDKNEFKAVERHRLPFFIGSQFGVSPRIEKVLESNYKGFVTVLGKSLLSGHVAGVSVYKINNQELGEKLLFLKNWTGISQKVDEVFKVMSN